ncbi:MAG: phosphatase PAP2 family protein [Rhizobiaceae bacterium]
MRFERGEVFLLILLAITAVLGYAIASVKLIQIRYSDFLINIALAAMFLLVGQFYRTFRVHQPIACATTALAIFALSGQIMRSFNYVLLPYQFEAIDAALADFDALFGFVWANYARMMADYPDLVDFLRLVYRSSYIQIVALIFLLGLVGRSDAIVKFSLANIVGGLVTILLWFLFPSSTPVAFQPLPAETAGVLNLFLNAEYGQGLVLLGQRGLAILNPSELGGIVGFPSFHTIMAIITVRYASAVPYCFAPVAIWNVFMLPATLLHGAHNLADIFGGLVVGLLSIVIAGKIADRRKARRDQARLAAHGACRTAGAGTAAALS